MRSSLHFKRSGKKKPNNLEEFIVAYDFYRLTQQLLGNRKPKQMQITQCQFYGIAEDAAGHGNSRRCKLYMRQSSGVRGRDKSDTSYTPKLYCSIVIKNESYLI